MIGRSLDDAAGEAFDKGARLLGLGYPGGAALERLAAGGDAAAHRFPAAMVGRPGHDFSFSGLKTALARAVRDDGGAPADLAASYQAAIVACTGRAGGRGGRVHGCRNAGDRRRRGPELRAARGCRCAAATSWAYDWPWRRLSSAPTTRR